MSALAIPINFLSKKIDKLSRGDVHWNDQKAINKEGKKGVIGNRFKW